MVMRSALVFGTMLLSLSSLGLNHDVIKESIIDLEQACQLGEEEMNALETMVDKNGPLHHHRREQFARLMSKLDSCKTRLVMAYGSCSLPVDEENGMTEIKHAHDTTPMMAKLATGCDWFVRLAGVIWGLQVFYGFLF